MQAVIVGASGLVGSFVLKKLLEDSRITQVIAVSRRPLQIQNSKLQQVLVPDFSNLVEKSTELKADKYFCCLGTTIKDAGSEENFRKVDFDAVIEFGKMAKSHNAQNFVLISAMGANPQSSIFYNRIKGEAEQALQALDLKSLTIFRPGLLLGHRAHPRRGEEIAMAVFRTFAFAIPKRLQRLFTTHAEHLATRMVAKAFAARTGVEIISSKDI